MKYRVRDHFHVHFGEQVHGPGAVVDLTSAEAERYGHQVELVNVPPAAAPDDDGDKPKRRRG